MRDDSDPRFPRSPADDERFRRLAENIREIFWILDPRSYRIIYINPAFERITGLPVEEVYADPAAWRRLLDPRDRDRVEKELDRRNSAGQAHNLEYRIVRPDGELRWIWMRGVPVPDPRGPVIVGVAEDITERKRAEEHREQSLSLLQAALQATADGILALDAEGSVTTFNSRLVELWQVPEQAIAEAGDGEGLWKPLLEKLRDPEPFRQRLHEVARQPAADSFDLLEVADGRIFEACSRPKRLRGQIDGRVWSFRDVTARARAERELRHRTRRLEMQNRLLLELARQSIAGETDRQIVLKRIASAAAELLQTARVGVWLYEHDRETLRLAELADAESDQHHSGESLRRADAPRYFAALEEERALAIEDVHRDPRTAELADSYCREHGIAAMLDAPIRAGGEVVGVVCFEHRGAPRQWGVEDVSFAGSIADLVSIALEAVERYRAEWGMAFLAEASAILASSLNYRTTIANVVQLAIPTLADWCLVELIEDGEIRRMASSHGDPEKEEVLRELERRYPPDWKSPHPAVRALRDGTPELVRQVTPEILAARTRDEGHRRLIERLETRSYMAVPLRARDLTLGAITFASARRAFEPYDLSLAQDLAGRAAMAIENALLYESAQESNRAKSNFLAVMSHELRTPLTAILGFTDLMLSGISGELSEMQQDQLQRVRLRSLDLVRIIEEILAYVQMDAGSDRPRLEKTDLTRLLRRFASAQGAMVEEAGLEFRVSIPDEPFVLLTDPARVEHILVNLLSNAVRFTPHGSVQLEARYEERRGEKRALIRVIDTGVGIETRDLERIFQPFVQVEDAMTREKGGTGLGLAVALRSARLLQGDISLESAPGQGSVFTMELPEFRRIPASPGLEAGPPHSRSDRPD